MKPTILSVAFLAITCSLFSQSTNYQIVSLETRLNAVVDTEKVNVLNELAAEYLELNPTKSIQYSNDALHLAEQLKFAHGIAQANLNLGNIAKNKNNIKNALENYEKSLQISVQEKEMYVMRDSYKGLSECQAKMNNYQKAYEYHQLYSQLKDELFQKESEKILQETLIRYEVAEKDKNLKNLKQEVTYQQTELNKEKQLKNFAIAGFVGVLLCVGGFVAYSFYKNGNY